MASVAVAAKNKTLEQKRLFRAKMKFSPSLLVTDGALKLDYASVIFVDPAVKIDEKKLNSLNHSLWVPYAGLVDYGSAQTKR